MSSTVIIKESKIERTSRVVQMEGLFDVAPAECSIERWQLDFVLPNSWNVGLIVGPSGSGKTTMARELFPNSLVNVWKWSQDKSILDDFPSSMSIKDIIFLLSSVGFSSPPSWVRPFSVLSNGEQFRVNLARTLAESSELVVYDEFTSVVDRNVARIGSYAVSKTVRRYDRQFIALSCHYDIAEWLEPDWVFQPHLNKMTRRRLRRPRIELEIKRVHWSAWRMFRKHHYLNTEINKAARCFCAFWNDIPVAFSCVLHFPHARVKNIKREHRTVCLPDFQGAGIGNALSDFVGSIVRGLGFRYFSQTSHPAMIISRNRSNSWIMRQTPTHKKALAGTTSGRRSWSSKVRKRLIASFEYSGIALPPNRAETLWSSRLI